MTRQPLTLRTLLSSRPRRWMLFVRSRVWRGEAAGWGRWVRGQSPGATHRSCQGSRIPPPPPRAAAWFRYQCERGSRKARASGIEVMLRRAYSKSIEIPSNFILMTGVNASGTGWSSVTPSVVCA